MTTHWTARPRWRITGTGRIALGPGKADLLQAIDRTGSITAAARALGMSYRRAWLLVETMNGCFARPLVATAAWRGRGATLTRAGRETVRLYRLIETRSARATERPMGRLLALLAGADRPASVRRAASRPRRPRRG